MIEWCRVDFPVHSGCTSFTAFRGRLTDGRGLARLTVIQPGASAGCASSSRESDRVTVCPGCDSRSMTKITQPSDAYDEPLP
jgi:hypothetical protein